MIHLAPHPPRRNYTRENNRLCHLIKKGQRDKAKDWRYSENKVQRMNKKKLEKEVPSL